MGDFKRCEMGHVYDSELKECPYCKGENLDDTLIKLGKNKPAIMRKLVDMAMCYLVGPMRDE